jgi:hypothetical protein
MRIRHDAQPTSPDAVERAGRPRRLSRLLAGTTAAAALTTGLLAVAAPAEADVIDPAGRLVHTTAVCDTSTKTFTLLAGPETGAVAHVTAHNLDTSVDWSVHLDPVSVDGYSAYQFNVGTFARLSLHVEYWWQDAAGTWLSVGEWVPDYVDQYGRQLHECRL